MTDKIIFNPFDHIKKNELYLSWDLFPENEELHLIILNFNQGVIKKSKTSGYTCDYIAYKCYLCKPLFNYSVGELINIHFPIKTFMLSLKKALFLLNCELPQCQYIESKLIKLNKKNIQFNAIRSISEQEIHKIANVFSQK